MEPIVVKPSRWKWGAATLAMALMFFMGIAFLILPDESFSPPAPHIFILMGGLLGPLSAWETIRALPRLIIDDEGVSGRHVFRVKRITWDDIITARVKNVYVGIYGSYKHIYVDVNNADGKYHSKGEKSPRENKDIFTCVFPVHLAKLNDRQAQEIVDIINRRARGRRD